MNKIYTFIQVIIIGLIASGTVAQIDYTPYDHLAAVDRLEKPMYNEDMPTWAKMLYKVPVNLDSISRKFQTYIDTSDVQKTAIIRYYRKWEQAISPYADDNGVVNISHISGLSNKTSYSLKKKPNLKNASNWSFWGPKETVWRTTEKNTDKGGDPAPWQVNVYSFDIAPTDNDIIYCGTESGYVNKSIDNGLTWQLCGLDYHFTGGVRAIAIDPTDSDIVYVASGNQIHKTIDGGIMWKALLDDSYFGASRLRIDPNNPNKIIAASDNGINISYDKGNSWQNAWKVRTWDIEIKPNDSNTIFGISSNKKSYFELVISTDGGVTFQTDPNFPNDLENTSGGLIAVTPADTNIVFVSMLIREAGEGYAVIYKGTFTGESWDWTLTKKGGARSKEGLGGFSTGQGYFDFVLEVAPDNPDLVFWGTCSLFKSTDGAVNFNKIGGYGGGFGIHPDIQDIKLLGDGEMWVSTDGGMSYSSDYFNDLSNFHPRNNGLIGSTMWGFDMGWNQDIIVGGRYHNGNTAITDFYQGKALRLGGAESPTGWIVHGKQNQAAFKDINKGYTTTIPNSIEETVSNKEYVFSKMPNMYAYGANRGSVVHHPNYHSVIYIGEGTGFWMSTDMGASFSLLYNFNHDVMYMQISHENPKVIYVDVQDEGLYKTEDGGRSWSHRPSVIDDYGNSSWKGKLNFVISPYDENVIYVCPQVGRRIANGDATVLKSKDGGLTWKNWYGSLDVNQNTKCLVVQPTKDSIDLVYLFVSSEKSDALKKAGVYYRKGDMNDWEAYSFGYPANLKAILALPFYRDSKLRVAGSGGVWESPFKETEYSPIVTPWINSAISNCFMDTLQLEDHSMLNHEKASWHWKINPSPLYISDPDIRNPKIVLGAIESFDVTLDIRKGEKKYSKTIYNMVQSNSCPSIDDCSNPAKLDKNLWTLVRVDSEESDNIGEYAFDDDSFSFWHTKWRGGVDPMPHEIIIDLGGIYNIHELSIINRPTGSNGRIKEYEIYLSNEKSNWGEAVQKGTFEDLLKPYAIGFSRPVEASYLKIVALSEVNNKEFSTIAEIDLIGCKTITPTRPDINYEAIRVFPVPTDGMLNISLPKGERIEYVFYSIVGEEVIRGTLNNQQSNYSFDLTDLKSGVYFIHMKNDFGISFQSKVIKQ